MFAALDWALDNEPSLAVNITAIGRELTCLAGFVMPALFDKLRRHDLLTLTVRQLKKLSKRNPKPPAMAVANLLTVLTSVSDVGSQGKESLTLRQNAQKIIAYDLEIMSENTDEFICVSALRNIEYIRPYAADNWDVFIVDKLLSPHIFNRLKEYLKGPDMDVSYYYSYSI